MASGMEPSNQFMAFSILWGWLYSGSRFAVKSKKSINLKLNIYKRELFWICMCTYLSSVKAVCWSRKENSLPILLSVHFVLANSLIKIVFSSHCITIIQYDHRVKFFRVGTCKFFLVSNSQFQTLLGIPLIANLQVFQLHWSAIANSVTLDPKKFF